MSRTIGGNPLRNLARRQGKVSEPAPNRRVYTEADRRRLLAPIAVGCLAIKSFGGKSWGGARPTSDDVKLRRTGDRYGYHADHHDLDNL